jgi:mannose-6-phosphate isomerase-like protein (cupin superfamily)/CBS domain-containing protein
MKDTVEKIMSKDVLKIDLSDSLSVAKGIFRKYDIRNLPVVTETKLVGMLSRTDIMRLSFGSTFSEDDDEVDATLLDMLTIKDLMNHSPKTISPTSSINAVAEILVNEKFQALPIVYKDELLGIITTTDIIKYHLNKFKNKKVQKKYEELRPWGNFEQFCKNMPCTVKIINVNPFAELSLQYHEHRSEFWRVIDGVGTIIIDDEEKITMRGDEFIIPAKTTHQIITKAKPLQILEISFGHFNEEDIIRLKDKYQRDKQEYKQPVLI